jgi:hypothetical protein
MTGSTRHIVKELFQSDSLDSVSLKQLGDLVNAYPYFGAARYLLLQKLREEEPLAFEEQAEKTALYFTDPFWMQWQLQHEKKSRNGAQVSVPSPEPEAIPVQVADHEETEEEEATPDEQNAVGKSAMQQAVQASAEHSEDALAFEPYHTVDYFASQGIKFVQEANPKDKLGKQLKSFTEWLKVMKKLPQKNDMTETDESVTATIALDAAHSIEEKEVVTETMAEVLAKQGKTDKAAEVYRKLSLLYPGKSAYFAARIEQLNVH